MAWTAETLLAAISKHALNRCITNQELVELTGLELEPVKNAARKLRNHKLIELTEPGCYILTKEGRIALSEGRVKIRSGPSGGQMVTKIYAGSLRTRFWRAIRIPSHNKFTIPEILPIVANGRERDPKSNLHHYIKILEEAGYLVKMKRRAKAEALTSNGYGVWWLEKNTGPLAPIWRPNQEAVYDPNTQETVSLKKEVASCG